LFSLLANPWETGDTGAARTGEKVKDQPFAFEVL
jgi:hypothetical protein